MKSLEAFVQTYVRNLSSAVSLLADVVNTNQVMVDILGFPMIGWMSLGEFSREKILWRRGGTFAENQ